MSLINCYALVEYNYYYFFKKETFSNCGTFVEREELPPEFFLIVVSVESVPEGLQCCAYRRNKGRTLCRLSIMPLGKPFLTLQRRAIPATNTTKKHLENSFDQL